MHCIGPPLTAPHYSAGVDAIPPVRRARAHVAAVNAPSGRGAVRPRGPRRGPMAACTHPPRTAAAPDCGRAPSYWPGAGGTRSVGRPAAAVDPVGLDLWSLPTNWRGWQRRAATQRAGWPTRLALGLVGFEGVRDEAQREATWSYVRWQADAVGLQSSNRPSAGCTHPGRRREDSRGAPPHAPPLPQTRAPCRWPQGGGPTVKGIYKRAPPPRRAP